MNKYTIVLCFLAIVSLNAIDTAGLTSAYECKKTVNRICDSNVVTPVCGYSSRLMIRTEFVHHTYINECLAC